MIGKVKEYFLEKYKTEDYIIQEKARTLLAICVAILLVIIPILAYSLTLHTIGLRSMIPVASTFVLVMVILLLFRKGYFALSANLIMSISFAGLWTAIFSGDYTGYPIERTDTIVLILALLTLTPFIILDNKLGIVAYFTANCIMFLLFVNKLEKYLILSPQTKMEYMIDNGIAFIFIGVISYRMFTVNKKALENAQADIVARQKIEMELRASEEKLKASLMEKDVLLKEIHHRVKNNFQIIYSLLNLQSRKIRDEEARRNYTDSQNRIRAMSLIHEKLYHSSNLSKINFAEYVETITYELLNSYVNDPSAIALSIHAERIELGIQHAIPCGLIISEVLTNTFKYAFPAGRGEKCTVKISMHENDFGTVIIDISDNGVGIPAGIDIGTTESLGMSLIKVLSEQLKGRLVLDRTGGTHYNISFERS